MIENEAVDISHIVQETERKMSSELIYKELSYQIMGAVFEVHKTLGPGFVESIYEKALIHEFQLRGIPFERQKGVTISYKDKVIGRHRLDFVVDEKIVLELKAATQLADVFKMRVLSYLKATGLRLGILINFGMPKVQSTRIVN